MFQPIFDLRNGQPRGYEGLIRPQPGSGFSDPGELFTAAEAVGRTVELDLACIATTIAAFAHLQLPGSLTLNLSPRTLEADDFSVHGVLALLARHRVDPARVVIELTEREAVEDIDRLVRAVAACRAAGMRLAADDVGAGNAGLRLLSQLKFDIVKIDLSLVQGGAVRAASQEVVRTLKDLADRWGALVIAEGIETPEQLVFVRSLGIRAGQGYLLGRPARRLRPLTPWTWWPCRARRATGWPTACEPSPPDRCGPPGPPADVDARTNPARLRGPCGGAARRPAPVGGQLGPFRSSGSSSSRRRHHDGWSPRPHADRARSPGRRIPPRAPSLASGA